MKTGKRVLAVVLAAVIAVAAQPLSGGRMKAAAAVLEQNNAVDKNFYAGKKYKLTLDKIAASGVQKTVWKVEQTGNRDGISVKFVSGTKTGTSAYIRCVKKGTALVTASVTMKDQKVRIYRCRISVKEPALSIAADKTELAVGDTVKLKVEQKPGKKKAAVMFRSGDKKVVKVNKAGKITALAAGTATITATLTCGNVSKKARVTITVSDAPEAGGVVDLPAQTVSVMDVECAAAGIAKTEEGMLLVTDTFHKVIWKVENGVSTVYAGAKTEEGAYGEPLGGYRDDTPEKSTFLNPWAIAPFLDGWAVSDPDNHAIRLLSGGRVLTINARSAGSRTGDDGFVLERPTGLAADHAGNLYVSDTDRGIVWRITANGTAEVVADGLADPMGLCWKNGVLYLAETGANRIVRIADGRVETLAGSGEDGFADGLAEDAAFSAPQGVAAGDDGAVYVADTCNSAIRVILDGRVDTLLARNRAGMEMTPMSPMGLLVMGQELYICDNFSRKVLKCSLNEAGGGTNE